MWAALHMTHEEIMGILLDCGANPLICGEYNLNVYSMKNQIPLKILNKQLKKRQQQ